jgi:hypothetical protein
MRAKDVEELFAHLQGVVHVEGDRVAVTDQDALRGKGEQLAFSAVFSNGLTRATARWLLWEIGQEVGVFPASIHDLYMAIGRGDVAPAFTVPAINIRAYELRHGTSSLPRGEDDWTSALSSSKSRAPRLATRNSGPHEYVAVGPGRRNLTKASCGPLFIQGDHFQTNGQEVCQPGT